MVEGAEDYDLVEQERFLFGPYIAVPDMEWEEYIEMKDRLGSDFDENGRVRRRWRLPGGISVDIHTLVKIAVRAGHRLELSSITVRRAKMSRLKECNSSEDA